MGDLRALLARRRGRESRRVERRRPGRQSCCRRSSTAPITWRSCGPRAGHRVEIEGRIENVEELLGAAREAATLADFLTEVSLVADTDEVDRDDSSVTLMTLHTAKGLEYPVVFIAGMEEGVFPHLRALGEPEELEEETAPVLRRGHPGQGAPVPLQRLVPEPVGRRPVQPAEPVHRRDTRTTWCVPSGARLRRRAQPGGGPQRELVEAAMRHGQAGMPVHGHGGRGARLAGRGRRRARPLRGGRGDRGERGRSRRGSDDQVPRASAKSVSAST